MSKNSPATDFNRGQSTAAVETEKSKPGKPSGDAVPSVVQVTNVEELYREVNTTTNVGVTIELQPGLYVLSVNDPNNVARANGGRLDLQPDMNLVGVIGDQSAVTIDTQQLPAQSFALGMFRGASIRVGLGSNAIEWLTIIGNAAAGAAIGTDLSDSSPTTITVANVNWSEPGTAGRSRAVDIRNLGASMADRRVDAVIEACDFSQGQMGIRFANFDGADRAEIHAVMKNNTCHHNKQGCFLANNRTDSAIVDVSSDKDRFVDNDAGCTIIGGIVITQSANSLVSNGNTTAFVARQTTVENNGTTLGAPDSGGIVALGGEAPGNPNTTSSNFVSVRLEDCSVQNNLVAKEVHDFIAFGARNTKFTAPTDIAGTHNTVAIELYDNKPTPNVEQTISLPPEPPKPTNKITVTTVRRRGDVQPDSTPA